MLNLAGLSSMNGIDTLAYTRLKNQLQIRNSAKAGKKAE